MTKKIIMIATILLIVGLVIFVLAMSMNKWDFTKLGGSKYETNYFNVTGDFKDISIVTDTADIKFVKTDREPYVVCYDREKLYHTVTIENGVLKIELQDERRWYDYIFNFGHDTVTVYLPNDTYSALTVESDTSDCQIPKDFTFESIDVSVSTGDVECFANSTGNVKIKASTGDITVKGTSALSLDLAVSTGEIEIENVSCTGNITASVSTGHTELENVSCNSFISSGDTGELDMENVIAQEQFSIERSTGDITLERCDAKEIYIKASTGDVRGSLLFPKIFFTDSSTGDVDVPKSLVGGKCEITTSTGDIQFKIIQ